MRRFYEADRLSVLALEVRPRPWFMAILRNLVHALPAN
jgi:hypothetical protein